MAPRKPRLPRFKAAGCEVETVLAALRRHGAAIVTEFLDAATRAQLLRETEPFKAASAAGGDQFTGFKTTRTGALAARSARRRALIADPFVVEYLELLMTYFSPSSDTFRSPDAR